MKKGRWYQYAGMVVLLLTGPGAFSQSGNAKLGFNPGLDIYTSYLFRGTRFGTGPSFQPNFKISGNSLTFGIWGAFDASGYAETDPYISYAFPFGLTLGITDYYYPDLKFFDTSEETGTNAFELNLGYSVKGLSLSGNYVVNEAGGIGSYGGDKYFQAGFTFSSFNIFLGAGDGWHTSDGEFDICNIGAGTVREIRFSEKFAIPLTGQVILNPEREQLFVVAGITF